MFIEGFLETCTESFIEGWVYTDDPLLISPVEVEILHCEEVVGLVKAQLFRKDLAEEGFDSLENGFHFIIPKSLRGENPTKFSARVLLSSGNYFYLPKISTDYVSPKQKEDSPPIQFLGDVADNSHRPLFVLGSARSGTSALTRCLLDCTNYEGEEEGHFFESLAYHLNYVEDFFTSKHDELNRNTTIRRIPRQYLTDSFRFILIQSAKQLYPTGKWLDKTPNSNMIYIAPILLETWPNAKFIFLKRRPIENLLSRRQKFQYSFEANCLEWAECMKAWIEVRNRLCQSSIVLDHYGMLADPAMFSSEVGTFLGLSDTETRRIETTLTLKRPQQSNQTYTNASLENLDLNPSEMKYFLATCGDLMNIFSYSYDSSYYS